MARVRAGDLRSRVTIQQPTETQDAFGEPDVTWSTYATRWARIDYAGGREFLGADALRTERRAVITMHYTSGITEKMRIVHGSTTFDIVSVANVGEADAATEIQAVVRG